MSSGERCQGGLKPMRQLIDIPWEMRLLINCLVTPGQNILTWSLIWPHLHVADGQPTLVYPFQRRTVFVKEIHGVSESLFATQ